MTSDHHTKAIRIDLSDPAVLSRVLKDYLKVSTCPVEGVRFPGMLAVVDATLALPDGSEVTCEAQVIRKLEGAKFLLQIQEHLDLERLTFLASFGARARKGSPAGLRASAAPATAEAPWGTPENPTSRITRRGHLPKKESSLPIKREALVQPPPKTTRRIRP